MAESHRYDHSRHAGDSSLLRTHIALQEQAPGAHAQSGADQVEALERRMLGEALGIHDHDVVGPLYTAGLRHETAVLLEWLPAIEVAWIDDVDVHERGELRRQFAEDPRTGTTGVGLLTDWLFVRPPHEAMVAARQALRHRIDSSDVVSGREMRDRIVSRCEAVGRASGGLFGLGALSLEEGGQVVDLREALGDEPILPPGQMPDIPH